MSESEPIFPVLCFYKGTMFTSASLDSLTKSTSAALRGGLFVGLEIVDADGREFIVKGATKLHGIGPFWGFNVFLNQAIRVQLDLEVTGKTLSVDEVRALVRRDFRDWHGWQSRDDFGELAKRLQNAKAVSEIMNLFASERRGNT